MPESHTISKDELKNRLGERLDHTFGMIRINLSHLIDSDVSEKTLASVITAAEHLFGMVTSPANTPTNSSEFEGYAVALRKLMRDLNAAFTQGRARDREAAKVTLGNYSKPIREGVLEVLRSKTPEGRIGELKVGELQTAERLVDY